MSMDAINSVNFQTTSAKPVSEPAQSVGVDLSAVAASMSAASAQMQNKAQGQPSQDEIQHAIASANKRAQFGHTNAQFSYHDETHTISVKIMDAETNEVIKEIPSEETLEMISKMWELAGIMVDEKR